jgi:hypothetical protein
MAGNGKGVVAFDSDSRLPCKYGHKCYQKNEIHHQKYKHPTKRKLEVSYIGQYVWDIRVVTHVVFAMFSTSNTCDFQN